MEYPILSGGKEAGLLRVSQEGLYTVFEGWMAPTRELTRLWVTGAGKSACLGLMEPRREDCYLRRRLSKADMRDFPDPIEYAATAEPPRPSGEPTEPGEREETEDIKEEDEDSPPAATGPPDRAGEDGLSWFPRADGSLCAFDGTGLLVALPVCLRHRIRGLRLRTIGGREYMVFRF